MKMKINITVKTLFKFIKLWGAILFIIALLTFIPEMDNIGKLGRAIDTLYNVSSVAFATLLSVTFMYDLSSIKGEENLQIAKENISSLRWIIVLGYLSGTLGYLGIDTSKEGNAWACFVLLLFLILGIFLYIGHVLKEIEQYKKN